MKFYSRKLIKAGDLNPRGTLFGGQLLKWIDEEAAIYAICKLGTSELVTKYMSEVNFIAPAFKGDIIEIGMEVESVGKTSLTLTCEVRNKITMEPIVKIDKIVFVHVSKQNRPLEHNGLIR